MSFLGDTTLELTPQGNIENVSRNPARCHSKRLRPSLDPLCYLGTMQIQVNLRSQLVHVAEHLALRRWSGFQVPLAPAGDPLLLLSDAWSWAFVWVCQLGLMLHGALVRPRPLRRQEISLLLGLDVGLVIHGSRGLTDLLPLTPPIEGRGLPNGWRAFQDRCHSVTVVKGLAVRSGATGTRQPPDGCGGSCVIDEVVSAPDMRQIDLMLIRVFDNIPPVATEKGRHLPLLARAPDAVLVIVIDARRRINT
mmetsp:Transcript_49255/g.130461  ORF Transcript_49255/g.130461 Transcript_49255/m.130461 type:complete len:250 (+) Transcript_49255:566-1315(+)